MAGGGEVWEEMNAAMGAAGLCGADTFDGEISYVTSKKSEAQTLSGPSSEFPPAGL